MNLVVLTNEPTQGGNKTRREGGKTMRSEREAATKGGLQGLVTRQTKQTDSVRGIKMANRRWWVVRGETKRERSVEERDSNTAQTSAKIEVNFLSDHTFTQVL